MRDLARRDWETVDEAMYAHAYPNRDDGAETVASFNAMLVAVPRRIKRLFGWRELTAEREEFEALEIRRLLAYTEFKGS